MTFRCYSWAAVNVITAHTEIPGCQWFPGLQSKAAKHCLTRTQTYEDTDRQTFVLLLKFASWKHAGFSFPGMIIVIFFFFLFLCVKGEEAAGNQRLSKSKKWYCHTSRMAVWCLFKRGGKKKNSPGDWIISSCQYVLAFPPPSLQQHVLFSAVLFSVTHIPEPCAAQLGLRCPKHRPSGHKKCSCNPPESLPKMYFIYIQYCLLWIV